MMKIRLFLFSFISLVLLANSQAEPNKAICEKSLQRATESAQPAPRRWQKIDLLLRSYVKGEKNPFEGTERDANAVGRVHMQMTQTMPLYRSITALSDQKHIDLKTYLRTKKQFDQYISAAVKTRPSKDQIFALIEANRLMALMDARVDFPEPAEKDQDQQQEEDDKKQDKKDEKKEKQPAKFPKNDDDQYKPKNKDVSSEGGSQEVVHIVETTVNPPLRVLRARAYDYVGLDRWGVIATDRPIDTAEDSKETMLIRPLGETQLRVFYNYEGYSPKVGQYKGYSVTEVVPGEYQLLISKPSEEIFLPLQKRKAAQFRNGTSAQAYTRKHNIPIQDWPKSIQDFIKANKGKSGMAVAAALTEYLSSKEGPFLYYSVGDKIGKKKFEKMQEELAALKSKMAEPLAMAHLGAFNCDGAAWIASLVLREYFNVPVRPAAGVTVAGFKQKNNRPVYVTRSSDPLHAWIEVFENGFWKPMDPTPKANNPAMGKNEDDDSEKLEQFEDADDSPPSEGAEGEPSEQESEGKGESKDDKEAKEAKEAKEKADKEKADKEKAEKDKDGKEKGAEEGKEGELIESGLAEKLNEQNGNGKGTSANSMSFLRRYEQYILEGYFEEGNRNKWLDKLDGLGKVLKRSDMRAILSRIRGRVVEISHAGRSLCDDSLIICLRNAQFLMAKGDSRGSFKILRGLLSQMDDLARMRTFSPQEADFYRMLQQALTTFRRFNHKNAEKFDLVERFLNSLPGKLSQGILLERYGVRSLSPDSIEVANLADDLLAGKLRDFQRLAAARDYVNFALRGMLLPQAREILLSQRSLDPRARQSIVVARNALEINRMLLQPRPGEHLFTPLVQGRQFAIGPRASTLTPDPKTPIERKLSVFLYDISGSMGDGKKDVYMAAVIAAFVEICLLEEDVLGRPSHEVIIVPFDTAVHEPVAIKTPQEALAFISSLIGKKTAASGGTDIQVALLEFYRLVGESMRDKAKNTPFQQFQHAGLILASDGGSTIDLAALEVARKAMDPEGKLKINMNFLAVGESNPDLESLANESSISTTKPNFIALLGELMGKLEASMTKIKTDKEAFASTESAFAIQRDVGPILSDLQNKAVSSKRPVSPAMVLELLSAVRDGADLELITKAGKEVQVKVMLENLKSLEKATFEADERLLLAYDLVTSHVHDQGRPLSRMTVTEEIELKRFLKWALK